MKNLTVFQGIPIPVDYATTQTYALLAKRNGGKTYTTLKFEEQMCDAGLYFVTLDPVGKHWALRAGVDGGEGKDNVWVLGGGHGDLPLEPTAGELVADTVVEHPGRYVLDVSGFETDADQDRFALAFAKRLFRRKAREPGFPLLLVLEEAESFIPERPQGGQAAMLGAFGRIMRQGRNHGLGMWMVAQRAQALNKGVLSQAEVLVVKQMAHKRDRDAVEDWVKANGTPEEREQIMGSLAELNREDAWVWSPSWLRVLQRARVLPRVTFDSSASVKAHDTQQAISLTPLDVEALGERMAATIERAKAEDPKELQRRVRELEKALAERPDVEPERVEVPVLSEDAIEEVGLLVSDFQDAMGGVSEIARSIDERVATLEASAKASNGKHVAAPKAPQDRHTGSRAFEERRAEIAGTNGDRPSLKAGARRMLGVLAAQAPMRLTRAQLGTLSKIQHTGGTFSTYFAALKREGFIDDSDDVVITDAGWEYLGEAAPAPKSAEEILEMYRSTLKSGARRMLDVLVEIHPHSLGRGELGERTGIEPSGGTFSTYLGHLRRNGLVEVEGGLIVASDTLFLAR
jgi:hypothetical protein